MRSKGKDGSRMLRFTKRADYGLMAIHYIAVNDGFGAVSAKRIAEEFAIRRSSWQDPPAARQAGAGRQYQRAKGGYALARRPTEITVGQVIRALEGPINIVCAWRTRSARR